MLPSSLPPPSEKHDGRLYDIVTWGDPLRGGDLAGTAEQLVDGASSVWSTDGAFAAATSSATVVAWGDPERGGDAGAATTRIAAEGGVVKIVGGSAAFAALTRSGSVVTWGASDTGGDSSIVSAQLAQGVADIFGGRFAFAALRNCNASVESPRPRPERFHVDLGTENVLGIEVQQSSTSIGVYVRKIKPGGLISAWNVACLDVALCVRCGDVIVAANNVDADNHSIMMEMMKCRKGAVGALRLTIEPGIKIQNEQVQVVTWGNSYCGGDSTAVAAELAGGVSRIFSNMYAFAALKEGGAVVTWGLPEKGGDSQMVSAQLASGVMSVAATSGAFAALRGPGGGPPVTWGDPLDGGDCSGVADQLDAAAATPGGIVEICGNCGAFAARTANGAVVCWGDRADGGDVDAALAAGLSGGVVQVATTGHAFAALRADGTVICWGDRAYGGEMAEAAIVRLAGAGGAVRLWGGNRSFAAATAAGDLITWGGRSFGGSGGADWRYVGADGVSERIVCARSTRDAFAALTENGSILTCGDPGCGGDGESAQLGGRGPARVLAATDGAFAALIERP